MTNHDWQQATESLVRGWLGAHFPPGEPGRLFPDIANLFGMTGTSAEAFPGTPHFQHFTAALQQFAEWQGQICGQPVALEVAIQAWLALLKAEAQRLGPLLDVEVAPMLAWLDAQSRPILGPAREMHAKWAAVARAGAAHVRALAKLRDILCECLPAAVERFSTALEDVAQPPLAKARDLFHLWARSADAAYRELAFTERYAQAFADCVNTASTLRLAWSDWQRQGPLAWFGLTSTAPFGAHAPTRAEHPSRPDEADAVAVATSAPPGATHAEPPPRASRNRKPAPGRPAKTKVRAAPARRADATLARVPAGATKQQSPPKAPALEFDIARIVRPTEN